MITGVGSSSCACGGPTLSGREGGRYPWIPDLRDPHRALRINLLLQPAQQRYAGLGLIIVALVCRVFRLAEVQRASGRVGTGVWRGALSAVGTAAGFGGTSKGPAAPSRSCCVCSRDHCHGLLEVCAVGPLASRIARVKSS